MFIVLYIRAQPSLRLQPRTLLGTEGGRGHCAGTGEGGYQGDQQPEMGEWVAGVSESISWSPGGQRRRHYPWAGTPSLWHILHCPRDSKIRLERISDGNWEIINPIWGFLSWVWEPVRLSWPYTHEAISENRHLVNICCYHFLLIVILWTLDTRQNTQLLQNTCLIFFTNGFKSVLIQRHLVFSEAVPKDCL